MPAEYFYVLGLGLPPQVSPLQQYQMVIIANEQQVLDKLNNAIETGIINAPVVSPMVEPAHEGDRYGDVFFDAFTNSIRSRISLRSSLKSGN